MFDSLNNNYFFNFILFFGLGVLTYYTLQKNIFRFFLFLLFFEILYFIMYNKFWSFIPRVVLNFGYLLGYFLFYFLKV